MLEDIYNDGQAPWEVWGDRRVDRRRLRRPRPAPRPRPTRSRSATGRCEPPVLTQDRALTCRDRGRRGTRSPATSHRLGSAPLHHRRPCVRPRPRPRPRPAAPARLPRRPRRRHRDRGGGDRAPAARRAAPHRGDLGRVLGLGRARRRGARGGRRAAGRRGPGRRPLLGASATASSRPRPPTIKAFARATLEPIRPHLVLTHRRDDAHQDHRVVAEPGVADVPRRDDRSVRDPQVGRRPRTGPTPTSRLDADVLDRKLARPRRGTSRASAPRAGTTPRRSAAWPASAASRPAPATPRRSTAPSWSGETPIPALGGPGRVLDGPGRLRPGAGRLVADPGRLRLPATCRRAHRHRRRWADAAPPGRVPAGERSASRARACRPRRRSRRRAATTYVVDGASPAARRRGTRGRPTGRGGRSRARREPARSGPATRS